MELRQLLQSGVECVLDDIASLLDESLARFQQLLEFTSEHDGLSRQVKSGEEIDERVM